MGKENIKSFFSAEEVEKIEGEESQDEREQLLGRMQEILDQEAPLSEADQVELDYIEIELREIDKVNIEQEKPVVTIGGFENPNAETLLHKKPGEEFERKG